MSTSPSWDVPLVRAGAPGVHTPGLVSMRRVDRFDEGLMVLVVLVGIALGAAPLSVNLGKPQRAPLDLGRPHTATGAFLSASHIPGEADRPMRGSPAWGRHPNARGTAAPAGRALGALCLSWPARPARMSSVRKLVDTV